MVGNNLLSIIENIQTWDKLEDMYELIGYYRVNKVQF